MPRRKNTVEVIPQNQCVPFTFGSFIEPTPKAPKSVIANMRQIMPPNLIKEMHIIYSLIWEEIFIILISLSVKTFLYFYVKYYIGIWNFTSF